MITEAGGLVGNFTGEPDFLYQREILAGSPRIYGQLVKTLAPYTRVIAETATAVDAGTPSGARDAAAMADEDGVHDAALEALKAATAAPEPEAEPAAPKRTRITASAKAAELASGLGDGSSTPNQANPGSSSPKARTRGNDDAPF